VLGEGNARAYAYACPPAASVRNTAKSGSAYQSDWVAFEAFCRTKDRSSLPATPDTVAAYAAKSAETLKANTVERRAFDPADPGHNGPNQLVNQSEAESGRKLLIQERCRFEIIDFIFTGERLCADSSQARPQPVLDPSHIGVEGVPSSRDSLKVLAICRTG
jgi:hypothetical protein